MPFPTLELDKVLKDETCRSVVALVLVVAVEASFLLPACCRERLGLADPSSLRVDLGGEPAY
jgi:hypothetical protein